MSRKKTCYARSCHPSLPAFTWLFLTFPHAAWITTPHNPPYTPLQPRTPCDSLSCFSIPVWFSLFPRFTTSHAAATPAFTPAVGYLYRRHLRAKHYYARFHACLPLRILTLLFPTAGSVRGSHTRLPDAWTYSRAGLPDVWQAFWLLHPCRTVAGILPHARLRHRVLRRLAAPLRCYVHCIPPYTTALSACTAPAYTFTCAAVTLLAAVGTT